MKTQHEKRDDQPSKMESINAEINLIHGNIIPYDTKKNVRLGLNYRWTVF